MYPSWPDFTLLTPCLFNRIAGGVLISMGLHDNMKMSPKLGQNGNSETGGHGAFSEPKPVREHPQLLQLSLESPAPWWATPLRVLQHARITALFFQCILLFPNMQTNPKYVPLPNLMLIAHVHSRVLCVLLPPKHEWISLQTTTGCNSDCRRRARHQKSVKTSNYMRPGPQLMQTDRAPRSPRRHDAAD